MEGRIRTTLLFLFTVILCLTGAWISGELVILHADLWGTGPTGLFGEVCHSVRSLGMACVESGKSRWSAFAVPVLIPSSDFSFSVQRVTIPISFASLAYFVFLATWLLIVGRKHLSSAAWQRIPMGIGWGGMIVSGFYMILMLTGMEPTCVWCVAVHLVNLTTVVMLWRLLRTSRTDSVRETARDDLPAVRLGLVQPVRAIGVASILIVALWFYRHEQLEMGKRLRDLNSYKQMVFALRDDSDFLLREYYAQPVSIIPEKGDETPAERQHQLVVFTDFKCPACYCGSKRVAAQIVPAFDGRLSVSIRHYPLCSECNDLVEDGIGSLSSCVAAYAAEAARMQGGAEAFERMCDLLFENRRDLSKTTCIKLAAQLGLDVDRFEKDLGGEIVRSIVAQDIFLADSLGVKGTPAFFLDGRRVTAFGVDNALFWQTVASNDDQSMAPGAVALDQKTGEGIGL